MTGSFQNDKGSLKKVDGSEEHLLGFLADGLHTSISRSHVRLTIWLQKSRTPLPSLFRMDKRQTPWRPSFSSYLLRYLQDPPARNGGAGLWLILGIWPLKGVLFFL